MKKIFAILIILFWSMIFPNLSFNNFTTEITDENISYSDLYNQSSREEILKNAEFKFWFLQS